MATFENPYNVTLACDGGGWVGSFGIAVQALAEDVLSDGKPFEARVTYENDGGDVNVHVCYIEEARGGTLTTTEKYVFQHDGIRKLEI